MPVKGTDEVNKRIKSTLNDIGENITRKTMLKVLMTGQNHSVLLTPVDTSNLINSRFLLIENKTGGFIGKAGYSANYAAAVHRMSGKLKGQPRAHFGKTKEGVEFGGGSGKGRYWDPNAEPRFLEKGFEDNLPELRQIIIDGYKI